MEAVAATVVAVEAAIAVVLQVVPEAVPAHQVVAHRVVAPEVHRAAVAVVADDKKSSTKIR